MKDISINIVYMHLFTIGHIGIIEFKNGFNDWIIIVAG